MINYQIIVEYLGSNYVGWQYSERTEFQSNH